MSLEVYSVPLRELLDLPGSGGHEELIEQIQAECWFVNEIDEMFEDDLEHLEEGEVRSLVEAVRRIIGGGPLLGPAYAFGYGFEAICWGLGSTLAMQSDSHLRSSERDLDAFLARCGVRVRWCDLYGADAPLDLPENSSYPFIGWWTPDQIAPAFRTLVRLPLRDLDEPLALDVQRVLEWVEEAVDQEDGCIVGFMVN